MPEDSKVSIHDKYEVVENQTTVKLDHFEVLTFVDYSSISLGLALYPMCRRQQVVVSC